MRVSAVATAIVCLLLAPAASCAGKAPALTLSSVAMKRASGGDRTVELHVRLCASVGPRAVLMTSERRTRGGIVRARSSSVDPLGVDMTRVAPYDCVRNYLLAWLVDPKLVRGGGTYTAVVRLRDGYGRTTPAVTVTFDLGS